MTDATIKTVTVYESWVQVADKLTDEQKGKFYHAIMHYALYGKKPKLESPLDAFFIFVQPSIDKSNKRKNAGSNGGKKTSKMQAKCKQNASKTEAKNILLEQENKQTASKEKEKEKVKEKEKEKVKDITLTSNIACECEEIAKIYPKDKVGDFRKVIEAVIRAVNREMENTGVSANDAVALVKLGTLEYAKMFSGNGRNRKHRRYMTVPEKFFDEGMYNYNPEVWGATENENTDNQVYDWRKEISDIDDDGQNENRG